MCLGGLVQLGLQSHGSWAQDLKPTQTPHPTLGIGSTQVSELDGMTMMYVSAGDSLIGSDTFQRSERPPHTVYLDAFWIDQTEVTNGMYTQCVVDGACTPPAQSSSSARREYYGDPEYDDYPVIYVDWQQANAYCEWAGRRLPTEAEWEKAARGADGREYPWGDVAPEPTLLNYDGNVGDTTAVGLYPDGASPYGVLDMMGNVLEWVSDCYGSGYYAHSPRQNPTGPATCEHQHRVVRGSCSWAKSVDQRIGAADRLNDLESTVYADRGFRCALSPSSLSTATVEGRSPVLKGEYLGQPKPGLTPEPFAPEVFSTAGRFSYNLHSSVYFTPDGKVYFTNQELEPLETTILFMEQQENGVWTEPQAFPPPEDHGESFLLSPDGRHRLYVYSSRSLDGAGEEQEGYTLWFVDRTETGWSEPYSLAHLNEDQGPIYFSAEIEGGLGGNDVYRSGFVDGCYMEPENLGDPINSEFSDTALCVAPDESYLIFYRFHSTNRAVRGLYLSFRRPDHTWTEPVHLDREFGIGLGFDASLSPDGKYLFFLDRGEGIYWVDANVVDGFR
jgi:formylglycine-generating enzyme required for sulfatase activity